VNRMARLLSVASIGAVIALIGLLSGVPGRDVDVIVLGAGLVVGNLVELRPANRSSLPIGFAVSLVLVRATSPREYLIVLTVATIASAAFRDQSDQEHRMVWLAEVLTAGLAGGAAYRALITGISSHVSARASVLIALAVAGIAQLLVVDLVDAVRRQHVAPVGARGADLALVTSGILMSVGYGGLAGRGRLGLWGPVLFAIPLVAGWYSFERLARTRHTFRQTVRALGVAPELGGLARTGHVERVALLSVELGRALGVGDGELEDLETAAWLHHLGAVCIDAPTAEDHLAPSDVARAGAEMLRTSHALTSAGDIVAAEPNLHRPPNDAGSEPSDLLGQILKVASAYDELTEGDDAHALWAVDALFTGPAYVYDGRVLTALEDALRARGVI
jgi:hypothetical protein